MSQNVQKKMIQWSNCCRISELRSSIVVTVGRQSVEGLVSVEGWIQNWPGSVNVLHLPRLPLKNWWCAMEFLHFKLESRHHITLGILISCIPTGSHCLIVGCHQGHERTKMDEAILTGKEPRQWCLLWFFWRNRWVGWKPSHCDLWILGGWDRKLCASAWKISHPTWCFVWVVWLKRVVFSTGWTNCSNPRVITKLRNISRLSD